ncbi:MAG: S9 family peptidase, partial [Pseudomonadota bacterium]
EDDAFRLDLWEYNVADRELRRLVDSTAVVPEEGELSEEEKARRERQRIAGLTGIVAYDWAPDGQRLMFPLGGDLYIHELATGDARQLTQTDAFETDPQVSPLGSHVAFIRDQDLFVVNVASGEERALTADGEGIRKNGMAEFVAQEEMDRDTGYWWAPDDAHIAFLQVDESPVPITQRYEIYASDVRVIDQRYPYAGADNVRVRLGVVRLADGDIRWIDLGEETDIYVPRVKWLPDGERLSFQVQSRDQQRLELRVVDIATGAVATWLTEEADTFVNLHHDLRFLQEQNAFVWSSERSGYRQLELRGDGGGLIRDLTSGTQAVDTLEGVDEASGYVYYTAASPTPLDRNLLRVRLDGAGEAELLTDAGRFHDITMSSDASVFVASSSAPDQPPQVALHAADGERIAWLVENALDGNHPYAPYLAEHRPTRFGTLTADDGQTLHYRMVLPSGFSEEKRYPVLIYVYGGPHVQMVNRGWARRVLFEQYLAQQGVLVFALDNRGSARRGTTFENPIYKNMGRVEVADQMVGATFLREQAFVDPDRIGVFGWSYGGYMTLHLMFQHPDTFAAGVSVAPVTDWKLYDTHYTERYMGHPETAADAYRAGAVFPYTAGFEGDLMVIHGMADDNVLFSHSTVLYEHLQQQGVLFDTMVYPGGKHGISGQAPQTHVYRTIASYLLERLTPER